jgi:hypothetical protein
MLAGSDGPGRRALPVGELLRPAPLGAVLVLVLNDWLLKPSGALPSALTGKLSDLAGLLFAPLLVTALLDLALLAAARAGAPVDFSLGPRRLLGAVLSIGVLFTTVKLWPPAAAALVDAAGVLGLDWRIAPDPSDLFALPALAVALWLGWREIARVPLGRVEVIERAWRRGQRDLRGSLGDVARAGAPRAEVDALAAALAAHLSGGPDQPVWEVLRRVRRIRHTPPERASTSPNPRA